MSLAIATPPFPDAQWIMLAREIIMDLYPIEEILTRFGITHAEWEIIRHKPVFLDYIRSAAAEWNSTMNGGERIKAKSLILIENYISQAYTEVHNEKTSLRDRTELLKLIARLGGVGEKSALETSPSDRITITINMGDEKKVTVEKDVTPAAKVIEHMQFEDHL